MIVPYSPSYRTAFESLNRDWLERWFTVEPKDERYFRDPTGTIIDLGGAIFVPAKAAMGDIAWLAGAWVGTTGAKGATSIEERWSPPLGGAMLAVSRTVSRAKDKMVAFEFLRIVEREGGLVYIAQPGGRTQTEFVLTDLTKTRAVFENPRHDSPQRIVYEVSAEGGLTASIGFMKGGSPRRFEFKREGTSK